MNKKPVLHTSPGSQHCRRVALLIHEAELDVDTKIVDVRPPGMGGENESTAFLELNPNAKVPVLTHDDNFVLTESNAIMAYPASGPEKLGFGRVFIPNGHRSWPGSSGKRLNFHPPRML